MLLLYLQGEKSSNGRDGAQKPGGDALKNEPAESWGKKSYVTRGMEGLIQKQS